MRVLHLTAEFPPFIWGGLGTAVGGLAAASARAGLDVKVLLVAGDWFWSYGHRAETPEGLQRAMVADRRLEILPAREADAVAAAVRFAARWRPDVLHVHPVELWPIARGIREQTGIPIVYTVHSLNCAEYEIGREPPEILDLWRDQQELIAGADRVLVLTRDERDLLLRSCPAVAGRVRVLGNGIDERAEAGPARRGARKRELTVLFAGRFVERKGIRELFAAIPLILEKAPATRFVLVGGHGTGASVEVGLPPELERWRDRVHFTGWLAPSEVTAQYQSADIQVIPSWYEPFGMVVLEGMLHGLALVASDLGGPAEILEHERTGLLVPPRDSAALAAAVLRLLHDASLRQSLARAAAAEVRRRWLWPRIVERMRDIYLETAA
ncbi:MAG TPA: glycosyltransferase family 4 protein [Thermoanaerobaculia bacterium]|nr:glycosyltransferase family 4 protein [Thermoanaerobaculia bacterium]